MEDLIAICMGIPVWMWLAFMGAVFIIGSVIHYAEGEWQRYKLLRKDRSK